MKKLLVCIITASALLALNSTQTMATNPASVPVTEIKDTERADAMVKRLNEIDAMDKSAMSPLEKRALRKEVRAMKKEATQNGGGVYISVGAIIIILLLLIILL